MPLPTPRRTQLSLPLLGGVLGTVIGVLTFAATVALWRSGATHVAALGAEVMLLTALAGMAGAILSAEPARLRRSRVPTGRALPRAWWPPQHDPIPLVAACIGTPIVAGAGAAIWLLH